MLQSSNLTIEATGANSNEAMGFGYHFKNGTSIKSLLRNLCVTFVLLFMGSHIYGQDSKQVYLGLGMGFDYGGLGGKIEYLPVKHFGLFGGVGYDFLSAGWNVGATYKILPDNRVSPNLMLLYGYNGVSNVTGASEYNMTSYGVTIGGNLDIKLGTNGSKLSIGLFVPVRSQKFMDNYNAMKNDSNIKLNNDLMPIAISVGYNILLE